MGYSATAAAALRPFADNVIIAGVKSKPELNGKMGMITGALDLQSGRVLVQVEGTPAPISLKPENLEPSLLPAGIFQLITPSGPSNMLQQGEKSTAEAKPESRRRKHATAPLEPSEKRRRKRVVKEDDDDVAELNAEAERFFSQGATPVNAAAEAEEDEEETELKVAPRCCGRAMEVNWRKKDGKLFYSCSRCSAFKWASDASRQLHHGPPCKCGQPSLALPERGVWVCAKTGGEPCDFEEDATRRSGLAGAGTSRAGPSSAGAADQEYLVGEETLRRLQRLFDMDHHDGKQLGVGRDANSKVPRGYYDSLKVQRAWRVRPPAQTVAQYEAFRAEQRRQRHAPTPLRPEHANGVKKLLRGEEGQLEPLCEEANELLLLHGTKAEIVSSILAKSLDPGLASKGLFGAGTYFAEHPAKIDQYTVVDREYRGGRREGKYGAVCALHNQLYPLPELHPGNAHYALVCRVVLGTPKVTKHRTPDGTTAPSRTHSLLAKTGGDIKRFREFVVFDKRAIQIEYLVCYTRTKRFCHCGDIVRARTVDEEGLATPRPFIACANAHHNGCGWSGGCGLSCALPRCYCPKKRGHDFFSAKADLAKGAWVCTKRRCGFRELIEQGVDLRESEDDDDGEYESDFIDDEGVEDDGEEGEESYDEGEESEGESEADNTCESDEQSD